MIPLSDEGYAVDLVTRTVHQRYAAHAAGFPRTRSRVGVETHLGLEEPKVCRRCWPNYRKPRPRKR